MMQAGEGKRLRAAWLVGDGVGRDVMEAVWLVLDGRGLDIDFVPADIGWEFWRREGNPLPDRTMEILRSVDCAIMGPVLSKTKEEALEELNPELKAEAPEYVSPLVQLRREFGLSTRIRPCKAFQGNPHNFRDDLDITVFIENTEGLYCGVEFNPVPGDLRRILARRSNNFSPYVSMNPVDVALSARIVTRQRCESVLRRAFDYAARTGRERLTITDKPSVLRETGGLFVRTAVEVAADYPSVRLEQMDVDALCMFLLRKPEHYRVIAATSLFGSIVGDLCMQLAGGLGMAPTGAVGEDFALFSPFHGPAPMYAGQYKVNPLGAILSAALMLEWSGRNDDAMSLRTAVAAVMAAGEVKTYDLGGVSSTMEVAEAVARAWNDEAGEA